MGVIIGETDGIQENTFHSTAYRGIVRSISISDRTSYNNDVNNQNRFKCGKEL